MSSIEAISLGNNMFTVELAKQMNSSYNSVVSPLSIFLPLALLCLGAEDTTEAQLKQVIHLNNCSEIHTGIKELLSALHKTDEQILNIENTLFVEQTSKIFELFMNSSKLWYNSKTENTDFRNKPRKAWEEIISWLTNKSEGTFHNVSEKLISNETKFVVFNTAYLFANWTQKFPKQKTEDYHFTLNNNETVPIKLMSVEGNFDYRSIDDDKLSIIALPYEKSMDLCMYVILPYKDNDIQKIIQDLSYEKLSNWTNPKYMTKNFTNVYIPHFKIDGIYSMKDILSRMGMPDVFNSTKANFSSISQDNFFVSDVISFTTVVADEDGASMTANMDDEFGFLTLRLPQVTFKADHPFIYIIQHKPTESYIFYGIFSGQCRGVC